MQERNLEKQHSLDVNGKPFNRALMVFTLLVDRLVILKTCHFSSTC
jgi:hypothetical protein